MQWWERLKSGLKKTTDKFSENLHHVFVKKKLDQEMLDALTDAMIMADFGVETAHNIRDILKKEKFEQDISETDLKNWLADHVQTRLSPIEKELKMAQDLTVICVVGVNGSGKTTNIAKLADYYQRQGKKVHVAACDTFRAAAVAQLSVWAKRVGFTIHTTKENGDSAGLAYDALKKAKADHADILFIDTAGRLHNKTNLMDELKKISRVIKKIDENAPHHTLLVLDSTTGQNALLQMQEFKASVQVNGLILTKLDGTAKGGIVVALAEKFNIPLYFIGVGEQVEDLQPFNRCEFSKNLFGCN
ncbi:MAG: Signal recognition particle receptor FtsY [Holosporales bacterium]